MNNITTLPAPLRLISRMLQQVPHTVPGKARFARALLRSSEPSQLVDRYGHRLAVPSLQESISYHLYADGEYEPAVVRLLRGTLEPGHVFVDVGASVGAHSVIASDLVASSGRVIAVEPAPQVRAYLTANLQVNRAHNVTIESCALSDHIGTAHFYLPGDQHFGMATLIPRFHDQPVAVETTTLDQMMDRFALSAIDLMKVDVEGAEALVFRGGEKTLTNESAPLIIFEFLDWAENGLSDLEPGSAQRILRDYGYNIWDLHTYLAGGKPLSTIITAGNWMLVAQRGRIGPGGLTGLQNRLT